jgi:hypothetical protein
VERVEAIRAADSSWAFVYLPAGTKKVEVNTSKVSGAKLTAWWYSPRDGKVAESITFDNGPSSGRAFEIPDIGVPAADNDWVLVIDDASKNYSAPGQPAAGAKVR